MVTVIHISELVGGLGQEDSDDEDSMAVEGFVTSLPTHRRAVVDEEVTYLDLSEIVHHLKILIKIKPGCDERDVWLIRNRILDLHRIGML